MTKTNLNKFSFIKSIFPKLFIIVILFGIILNICVWAFFRYSSDIRPRKLIPLYIFKMNEYVVKDIGFPPDTLKAKRIADELNINIRFQSHNFSWTTSENVPKLEELAKNNDFNDKYPNQESFSMQYDKHPYSIFKSPKGVFIVAPLTPQDFFNPERAIIILIIIISLVFVPLYFLLRWLFNPLRKLSAGVQQIGGGNYDVDLKINRSDELGELASSIKEMAARIKNSMRSKEQLLLDVSHDLRTPLTRIKLGLEVDSSKEKINEDVNEMEAMLSRLLENYKAGSTASKLNLGENAIIPIIKDVIEESGTSNRITFSPGNNIFKACIDPSEIKTVFRNIIDNALKYSEDKVEVTINSADNNVSVSISDKGRGISESDLSYIFDPFYRADPSRSKSSGGFGLGLSICDRIVKAHKGKVEVQSKLNEGSTFTILLPAQCNNSE